MGIVVLGAGGQLGRLLRPVFPRAASWVMRSDVDICDAAALQAALVGADAVLCLAGVTPARPEPMALNTDLAIRTLDAAKAAGAGRVFLFSSASVYGRASGVQGEDSAAVPLSPYGVAKLDMERATHAHAHPKTVLRVGNVAGADAILGGWRAGFTLDTFEDGTTPRRSYIAPVRLACVLADLCVARDLPPLMNVAAPGSVQMGALLDAAGLAWRPRPADGETIGEVTLDTARLERFTAFEPSDSTPDGIVADWQKATKSR